MDLCIPCRIWRPLTCLFKGLTVSSCRWEIYTKSETWTLEILGVIGVLNIRMLVQNQKGSLLIGSSITALMEDMVSEIHFEKWVLFRYREEGIIILTPMCQTGKIHACNHNSHRDIPYAYHPRKFPSAPSQATPGDPPLQAATHLTSLTTDSVCTLCCVLSCSLSFDPHHSYSM